MPEPTDHRWGRVSLAKACVCGSWVAVFTYEYKKGLVWSDVWACVACGRTLYEWTWDSTMIACREIKAEVAAEKAAGAAVLARAAENAEIAEASGGWPGPKILAEQQLRNDIRSTVIDARKGVAKKKQMNLF